jgi:hypothetical protein
LISWVGIAVQAGPEPPEPLELLPPEPELPPLPELELPPLPELELPPLPELELPPLPELELPPLPELELPPLPELELPPLPGLPCVDGVAQPKAKREPTRRRTTDRRMGDLLRERRIGRNGPKRVTKDSRNRQTATSVAHRAAPIALTSDYPCDGFGAAGAAAAGLAAGFAAGLATPAAWAAAARAAFPSGEL